MKTTPKLTITEGSGDIFADLGFSPAEARNLHLRSQMITALRKFIEKDLAKWTELGKFVKLKD